MRKELPLSKCNAVFKERAINLAFDGVKAKIVYYTYGAFELNTLLVSFEEARRVLSTLDGYKKVKFVCNTYIPSGLFEYVVKSCVGFGKSFSVTLEAKLQKDLVATLGFSRRNIAFLSTGVNMDALAICERAYRGFKVCCLATAGAKNNALRAGVDGASWVERDGTFENVFGTINIIILTNAALSIGAMAKALITVTEAKTVALQDLDVRSTATPQLQATGTGTDNVIVVSGQDIGPVIQHTGGDTKMGELMANATRTAVVEALKRHDRPIVKKWFSLRI